ncbi:N-6 DNA methylase [Streptomyces sp. NBC_00576]|uniref:N-6 DNA methylase n=1 Tax=Streptomyces sp. NBC_00576 TaxID=2903665 RepID=UPI002E7FC21A|nr:N-6 DNA methylase [Streptomyces sp. NBC_00576]WUB72491.1 SAM-dependent methyltransferase [Streptomyces sp. NBC_00576]
MSDFGEVRVSRSDIARLAGVKRPAVTNWERRHADFPAPVEGGDLDRFRADQVLEWLSGRTIPSSALEPGELTGTTYGDRFRAGLSGRRSGSLLSAVEQLAARDAERLRGRLRMSEYLYVLLSLVFIQIREPDRWSAHFVKDPETAMRRLVPGEESYGQVPLPEVVRILDSNPPGSPGESRQAFDRLLEFLRSTGAGAAEEFYTPRSVSRVMARALAAQGSAKRLHDPFVRTGELLSAYLDAVAEQGGGVPESVTGRADSFEAMQLAEMNIDLHGAQRPRVLPGSKYPARSDDFGDLPGPFDAVITNPPFGSVGQSPYYKPRYWRYGESRSGEFDWLQYVVSRLAPEGRAAVLMPAGAASRGSAERRTRASMIEDGVVECVMSLPARLFELTAVQTHIWFLRAPRGRPEQVLFVDGSDLGSMATRTRRALADEDVDRLVLAYTSWRESGHGVQPGLSRAVGFAEIAAQDHRLEPALYVREELPSPGAVDAVAAARNRLAELSEELERLHEQAKTIDRLADVRLRRYGL